MSTKPTALSYSLDFKARQEFWNPLGNIVLSKCNLIWNEGHGQIWNDHEAQK